MSSREHELGLTPSEQIQATGVRRLEKRVREYTSAKPELREGIKYLFEDDNAFYDPATGEVILRRFGVPRPPENKSNKWKIPVIWNRFENIESAIASTWHVAEAYNPQGGQQTLKDQAVYEKTGEVLDFLDDTPIVEEGRLELSMNIDKFLDRVGYRRALHPDRKRSRKMLETSVEHDSLGRNNPEAKKTQASVGRTTTKYIMGINEQIHTKYDQNLHHNLLAEREDTRKRIAGAITAIDRTLGYRKLHARFRREINGLISKLPDFLGHNVVRVGTYRQTAQEVLALLVRDFDDRTEEIMEEVLGFDEFTQYKEGSTLKDFLDSLDKNPQYAKLNITLHLREARTMLRKELRKGDKRMSDELKKRNKRLADARKSETSV
jgi:hypothetical protein